MRPIYTRARKRDVGPDDIELHRGIAQDPALYLQFLSKGNTMTKKDEAALKAKQGKRTAAAQPPEGFDEIKLDMPSVHWEDTKEVKGQVVDSDLFYSDNGVKRVLIMDLAGVHTRVYEQGGLRRLFDKVHVGDSVWIRTTGKEKLDEKRTIRKFEGGIKLGEKRTPIVALPPVLLQQRAPRGAPDGDGVLEE